jgi:putative nucleotidyltransferase with HDIG domain
MSKTTLESPPTTTTPLPTEPLRLSSIIGALSHALDLTEGQPPGHCMRACWIGLHVGMAMGLSRQALWELYYTLLLKDAGCSSNAERLCELYAHDDRVTKKDFFQVDGDSLSQLARFVFAHTAPGARMHQRLSRILHLMRHGQQLADELVVTRCERGAAVARQLGFPDGVAEGIRHLDEHWNGLGRPQRKDGESIPLFSRIALAAQIADVFHQVGGRQAALLEIRRRRGTWFDPQVADILCALGAEEAFWQPMAQPDFGQRLWDLEPGPRHLPASEAQLDAITLAFAQIVDAKSHFTYGHSERVGRYAEAIARRMGLEEARVTWVRRGALLHDLGKLGVSNSVLDKPGRLDEAEWVQIRRHPALTEDILKRLAPFEDLARIAGAHHERLDGRGYPRGLRGDDIPLETRIITTADIFDALTAERPYRAALPVDRALAILEDEQGAAIDPACLIALREALPALGLA